MDDVWGLTTKAAYEKAAETYQHCFTEKTEEQVAERAEFAALVKANSSFARPPIIDLGCGDGKDLALLWELGLFPLGLDYAEEMLAIAQKKCLEAKLFLADMRQPFFFIPDKVLFGAWTCSALAHIPREELPNLFGEVSRILVDGGIFFVSVREGEPGLYEIPYLGVEVFREKYTEAELCACLTETGFSILSSKTTQTETNLYPTILVRKNG